MRITISEAFAPLGRTMFHDLETLIESSVIATDGEMGSVRNFLFDEQSWTIRYLVVDVGNWLKRRPVLVAITAVEQPDWTKKTFRVHLTKDQVQNSPDVDSDKPVSRQQEIAMKKYFGWAYWEDSQFNLFPSLPPGREYAVHHGGLASTQYLGLAGLRSVGHGRRNRAPGGIHHGRRLLASRLLGCESRRLASQPLGADSHSLGRVHFVGPSPRECASHPREGLASVRRQNLRSGTSTVCIELMLAYVGRVNRVRHSVSVQAIHLRPGRK